MKLSQAGRRLDAPGTFPVETQEAAVIVAGGGVAGLCAAVAAARAGADTILVTDRPVLGGNCSSEIRVPMSGATHSPFSFYARETGLVEEIRNRLAANWSGDADTQWTALDRVYCDLVEEEPRLRLFLNTTVCSVETAPDRAILSMTGVQLRAERAIRFRGTLFVDCTGDGTLGALAGADFRQGREARAEFDEPLAPEQADSGTMGATLLWTTRDTGRPAPFKAPAWAIDVSALPPFRDPGSDPTRAVYRAAQGRYYGLWWAEFGGEVDTVHDDGDVCRHTRRLVYGIWDWIKNSGRVPDVETLELDWVAPLPGKRESRRLMGPVILTENDWMSQTHFDDAVAYTGWPIDIHPPRGYRDSEPGCTHQWLPGPSDLPLRALYSRNVPNLLFAGRNLSATHVALGSPRVIATTGLMGQAVGLTAAYCAHDRLLPREVAEASDRSRLREIQRRLLRTDQGLYGRALSEADDLARSARIRTSSTRAYECRQGDKLIALDADGLPGQTVEQVDQAVSPWFTASHGAMAVLPADGPVDRVAFRFAAPRGAAVRATVFTTGRPGNARFDQALFERTATVDNEGWADFALGADPGEGRVFLFHFPPQRGVGLWVSSQPLCGTACARLWFKPGPALRDLEPSHQVFTPCFRMSPAQPLLDCGCLTDGHLRPCGLPHQWSSAAMQPGRPEWIELDWPEPIEAGLLELVFDTHLQGGYRGHAATLVRDYTVTGFAPDGTERLLADVADNALRFRRHTFKPETVQRLRVTLHRTWGAPCAALYALRLYGAGTHAGSRT